MAARRIFIRGGGACFAVWEGSKGHVYEQLFWKAAGGALKRTAAALNVVIREEKVGW